MGKKMLVFLIVVIMALLSILSFSAGLLVGIPVGMASAQEIIQSSPGVYDWYDYDEAGNYIYKGSVYLTPRDENSPVPENPCEDCPKDYGEVPDIGEGLDGIQVFVPAPGVEFYNPRPGAPMF